jgi:hypothetical protein
LSDPGEKTSVAALSDYSSDRSYYPMLTSLGERGNPCGVAPTSSLSNANLNALAKAKLFLPESTRYPLSATLRKESEW